MKKRILFYCVIILISICSFSCAIVVVGDINAGLTSKTKSQNLNNRINDQKLEYNITSVLSKEVPNGNYTIASFEGNVLLAGQVPSNKYKNKAYLAVKNTAGVKSVFNYLTISKNKSINSINHDKYLTNLVNAKLVKQNGINRNNIKVVTCANVVYLLGKNAGTLVHINRAIANIKHIKGVKSTVNLIKI